MIGFIRQRLRDRAAILREAKARYDLLRPHIQLNRGFFVEAGGNDGLTQSNTLGLERWAGWRGLLIEPISSLAHRCKRNRGRCRVECCALVPFDFTAPTVEMWDCNLMSVVCDTLGDHEPVHLQKAEEYQNLTRKRVQVAARTLSSVLDAAAVPSIDFMSLDAEGFEPSILKGLNFDRHAPNWLLIEGGKRPEVIALLESRYQWIATIGDDELYRLRAP